MCPKWILMGWFELQWQPSSKDHLIVSALPNHQNLCWNAVKFQSIYCLMWKNPQLVHASNGPSYLLIWWCIILGNVTMEQTPFICYKKNVMSFLLIFDLFISTECSNTSPSQNENNFVWIENYLLKNGKNSSFFHNDKQELELKQYDRGDCNVILQLQSKAVLVSLNLNCDWYLSFSCYRIVIARHRQLAGPVTPSASLRLWIP